jgi:hypothetical protein
MKSSSRNLLVLFKNEYKNEQAIEQEVICLQEILINTSSSEQFCIAHELVNRNYITSNKKKLLKESAYLHLRPFRFFINKN